MNKYIVYNCPLLKRFDICTENSLITQTCEENDGCMIKEIINECNREIDEMKKKKGACLFSSGVIEGITYANCNILERFDIQEKEK